MPFTITEHTIGPMEYNINPSGAGTDMRDLINTTLDTLVANGRITQEERDWIIGA